MTKQFDIYGIGNALMDTEFEIDDDFLAQHDIAKGHMTLIDKSEKERLGRLLADRYPLKKHTGGGSAANTMAAIAQFGGRAFYSCKVANDRIGDLYRQDLNRIGVHTNLDSTRPEGITGQCLVMITPDAERTMLTFLGITQTLSPAQIHPAALRASRYLYIEGYLTSSETGRQAARQAQHIARQANVPVSLTLSDPSMVEAFKDEFTALMDGGIELLFCNREEAMIFTDAANLDGAVATLRDRVPAFVVTLGGDGALAWDGTDLHRIPTAACRPIDTNGAGDMFAGAFLHAITVLGCNYRDAAAFANLAAGKLVQNFGPRLDAATQREILQAAGHLRRETSNRVN